MRPRQISTLSGPPSVGAPPVFVSFGTTTIVAATPSIAVALAGVTAASKIIVSLSSNDATATCVRALAGVGTFTVYADVPPTANAKVDYIVFN
jgi:hypothetical protein